MNYKTYQWDTEFRAKHVLLIRDNKVQTVVEEKHDLEDLFSHEMQNIIVGLKEMIFIQMSRDYFVLEESPRREVPEFRSHRPKGRGPHIARSSDRKVYTLLKPAAIRTRMELPTPTGRTQTPHERRAHLRTFRSPRFKRAVGKTIAIPSTWIGPKENMVGGKRYRVLTDFGLKEPHE